MVSTIDPGKGDDLEQQVGHALAVRQIAQLIEKEQDRTHRQSTNEKVKKTVKKGEHAKTRGEKETKKETASEMR